MRDEPALDIRAKADQLLDLSQAMLAAAESDDWDEFELYEQQRRTLLEIVFGSQAVGESAKLHRVDVIQKIQLIDKAISDLISQQRDQAVDELRHLKQAREGDKAYRITVDDRYE